MSNQALRPPAYVGAWRRQIRGRQLELTIRGRCLVLLSDGKPCGRPANTYDPERGHAVCWYHRRPRGEVR